MIEIREPKFKLGQKVVDKNGNVETVVGFNSYHFEDNEYWYDVSYDEGTHIKTESFLKPYIEKPKTVWELQNGDECYFIASDGQVLHETWCNYTSHLPVQLENRKLGNCFLTKEEAENEAERRKIEAKMIKLGGRRVFKKGERNWYIRYTFYTDSVDVDYNMYDTYGRGIIYFDSNKECGNAIETIGEYRIKRYIFGVEE